MSIFSFTKILLYPYLSTFIHEMYYLIDGTGQSVIIIMDHCVGVRVVVGQLGSKLLIKNSPV